MRRQDGLDVGLDVPRGDPEAIRAAATRLRRVSGRALATAGLRGDVAADLSDVWNGSAADQATRELSVLAARARHVLPQLDDAGRALLAFADVLEAAIARTAVLRVRAEVARADHARSVAAAHATHADPAAHAALAALADERLTEALGELRRAHGRCTDELTAEGMRCARTLAALSDATRRAAGSGPGTAGGAEGLVHGLPLVELQLRNASEPPPDEPWVQSPIDVLGVAAAWTYNHTVVPVVNTAADVAQAIAEHPEDLAELTLGAGMIVIGGGGQVSGVALDATGVGVVAGAPLHVVAAGLATAGAATAAHGAASLVDHASRNDHELLREIDGPYPDRGAPGDPLPDWQRPEGAGQTWKGRVSDNGKGEVWQDPDRIGNPANHDDADSLRYMDPTDRYPDGYVRYHGPTGQPLGLDGKPASRGASHHPMTPEYTYDQPNGWNP